MTALPGINIAGICSSLTPSIQNTQTHTRIDSNLNGSMKAIMGLSTRGKKPHLLFTINRRFLFYFYSWTINGHVIIFTQQLNKICVQVVWVGSSYKYHYYHYLIHRIRPRCRTWINWAPKLPVFCWNTGIFYEKNDYQEWIKRNYVNK